jgi:hypothetical protein
MFAAKAFDIREKNKWLKYQRLHAQTYITSRVILNVIPMSLLCPSKNEVAFKITIELVIDQN